MEQQDLAVVPTEVVGGEAIAYPAGALERYSEQALNYLVRCRGAADQASRSEMESAAYLLAFWKQCDDDDAAEGLTQGQSNGQGVRSRFWLAYEEERDIPARWLEAGRSTLKDLRQAAEVEAKLLKFNGRSPSIKLPLMAAQEAGIAKSTLLMYDRLSDNGKALADAALDVTGTLKADFIKQITRVCNDYPELHSKVLDGIRSRQYKVPDDIRVLLNKYDSHKAAQAAAERERQRLEREAAARTAAEAQAEADRKLKEEIESGLPIEPKDAPIPEQGTPPPPPADEPKILTTYPVQELLDGVAFEGLQKRYERDTADFFTDMRELYAAVRKVDEITGRWAERLQDQHLSGHKQEMLLWETYSVAWNRLGKFKKLGGGKINSVPDFWAMIGELSQRAKGATSRCITYSQLSVKKYGPFKVAEISEEHYQPGRVEQ